MRSPRINGKAETVLEFCSVPRSRAEIAEMLGMNAGYVGMRIIGPLVDAGKLQMTMPEKPRSKFQRYYSAR